MLLRSAIASAARTRARVMMSMRRPVMGVTARGLAHEGGSEEQDKGGENSLADTLWGANYTVKPDEVAQRYTKSASAYEECSLADGWGDLWERIAGMLQAHGILTFPLAPREDKLQILDAGCGSGLLQEYFPFHEHHDTVAVSGFDLSEGMLELARKRGGYQNLRTADLYQELPYAPDAFDLVMCMGVLGYVSSSAPLREFWRVVRPGGHLVYAMRRHHFEDYGHPDMLAQLSWTTVEEVRGLDPFPQNPEFTHEYQILLLHKPDEDRTDAP